MVERVVVGPWKTNCYIYSSAKKECIIIDPGGSEAEIAARVDVLNMVPVGIALTHGHVDHLAALARLRDGYRRRGYKLPIAINPADRRFLGVGGREIHRESLEFLGLDELSFFGVSADELPKADVRLKEGDRVFDMDIVVLETPGHTPGSVCFYAEKEGVLFSGDTLFFDGVGRTDLPGGSEKKLRESIQKKIAVLPPEIRVFPGHGPFTTLEREKRGNSYFKTPVLDARPVVKPVLMRPMEARPGMTRPAAAAAPGTTKRPVVAKTPGAAKKPVAANTAKKPVKPVAKKAGKKAVKKVGLRPSLPKPKRPASRKPAVRSAAAKRGVVVSRKKPAQVKRAVGTKRPVQATRSTKAPGSGRKPAR
jgi:hydroxyacylglutathione hydrolase